MVPLTGQERAWTSPIWYTPSAEARKNAPAGMTVADLKAKGATALGDAQLKALIVGKAFWVRNNVTGEQFSVSYTAEGDSNVWHVGKSATLPSYVGNPMRDGYQGTTTPYKIEGGKVVTNVSQDPYCGHDLQARRHILRRAQQRVRLCQLRDDSDAAVRAEPARGECIDQFSIELGLTEQQRQQIVPIIKEEIPKLQALKKDTSAQCRGQSEAVEGDRRCGGRQDHAASQSGAAAEIPGRARPIATTAHRKGRKRAGGEARARGRAEADLNRLTGSRGRCLRISARPRHCWRGVPV